MNIHNLPEAERVYGIPELLGCILEQCDWRTVMAVSRVDSEGRSAARWVVEGRIRFVLQPFVDPSAFDTFLSLLHDTRSGVVGSVIRRLLAYNSDYDKVPSERLSTKLHESHDLNLLVHANYVDTWVDWFGEQGYGGWRYVPVHEGYATSVESVLLAIFPKSGQKVRPSISSVGSVVDKINLVDAPRR